MSVEAFQELMTRLMDRIQEEYDRNPYSNEIIVSVDGIEGDVQDYFDDRNVDNNNDVPDYHDHHRPDYHDENNEEEGDGNNNGSDNNDGNGSGGNNDDEDDNDKDSEENENEQATEDVDEFEFDDDDDGEGGDDDSTPVGPTPYDEELDEEEMQLWINRMFGDTDDDNDDNDEGGRAEEERRRDELRRMEDILRIMAMRNPEIKDWCGKLSIAEFRSIPEEKLNEIRVIETQNRRIELLEQQVSEAEMKLKQNASLEAVLRSRSFNVRSK